MTDEVAEKPVHAVLLVDDEPNILKALRRLLLSVEGYEVRVASSAAEGLHLLEQAPAAVVVSDQRMPEVTGAEFLEQVKKRWPETVRILLTGYADIEASIAAINQGEIFRYLTKPWDENEFLTTVRDAAQRYWLVQENKRLNGVVARQNVELQQWNARLKQRVLDQTASIRRKNDELTELNVRLQDTFDATIEAFSRLAELHDRHARAHAGKVADIALAMAEDLQLEQSMRETLRVAALLHDIGKIGIDREVLEKPYDYMTPDEQQDYETHPVRGQAAVDRVEALRDAGVLIRHHHENFDGSGFPDRLTEEAIPLGSRILALANGFDRLRHAAGDVPLEHTLMQLRQRLSIQYDPALYPALEGAVGTVYQAQVSPTAMVRMQLPVRDLREGMILEQDVTSGSGLLLLRRGSRLTLDDIEAILRYDRIDPIKEAVAVMAEKH